MKRIAWLLTLHVAALTAAGQSYLPTADFARPGLPQAAIRRPSRVNVRLVPQFDPVVPGQTLHLAVDVDLKEWAYYSPAPGKTDTGVVPNPAEIVLESLDLQAHATLWPGDSRYKDGAYAYQGRAIFYVPLTVPSGLAQGIYPIRVRLEGQICHAVCITLKGRDEVVVEGVIRVGSESRLNTDWQSDPAYAAGLQSAVPADRLAAARAPSPQAPAKQSPVMAGRRDLTFWAGLGLALLAGLILNVMPCVLPIIPLRIYSVIQMAGESRRRYVTLGLAFAAGMMLFFVGVAGANAVLKLAVGRAFSWSEQWQNPAVRIAMMLVLVVVAANMFGLFTVNVPRKLAARESADDKRRGGHVSSAGMGLMLAVLATPCSFGILLAALGWAQTQPLAIGTLVFLLIGAGMAGPHVLLAAFPSLIERLPRPGVWMERFRQTMGFVLLLVATWLGRTLAADAWPFWIVAYAVVLSFALWMWGQWVRYDAPLRRKLLVRGLAILLAIGGGIYMLRPPAPPATNFEPFDESALAAARNKARIVLVKFTASWCSSCAWIDEFVYDTPEVAARIEDLGVLALKADVTNRDTASARFLYERLDMSPPLTVVYGRGGGPPVLIEGEFGKSELLRILNEAQ